MKLENLENQIKNLPDKGKEAILALIDIKTEHEMDKVLGKLDAMRQESNAMRQEFNAIENKFDSVNNQLNFLKWAFGFVVVLITLLKFIP